MNAKAIEGVLAKTLPTLQDFIFFLVFAGVLLLGQRMMNIDGDLGRHLTIGQHILDTKGIPVRDLFSHTMAGEPLTPHEWLSQVIFAMLYRMGGLNLVVWGCAVILATTYSLLFRICQQISGSNLISAIVVFLGVFASSLHWLTRPHIFTMLLMVIWLNLLIQIGAGRGRAWLYLPLVMLLWVNLHGAFIAGLITLVIYFVGLIWEQRVIKAMPAHKYAAQSRPLVYGFMSSVIMLLVNPSGWRILETSFGYIQNRYLVGHTAEYLPPNFHDPSTWPFLILLIMAVFLFGAQGSRQPGPLLFICAAWVGMALYSTRNIPLFAIIAAPALALAGSETLRLPFFRLLNVLDDSLSQIQMRLTGWILPILLVTIVGAVFSFQPDVLGDRNRFQAGVFPVEAADWLEENPQDGNMFNFFPWGGYLLYRHWPGEKVFIDGQTDFYGESLTREYEQVISIQPGWEKVLEKYWVSWVIIPVETRLAELMIADSNWELIYSDETAVILRIQP